MLKCEKIVELMGYRPTSGGEQLPADLWKELLLSKKLDMSLFKLNMIRDLYPHKAIGLFKLYNMLSNQKFKIVSAEKKKPKHKDAIKVFSNP